MKDPKNMTAGEINKALDKLEVLDSALIDEMIAAGRGHERPSEYLKLSDPLSLRHKDIFDKRSALRDEISMRYGPNARAEGKE